MLKVFSLSFSFAKTRIEGAKPIRTKLVNSVPNVSKEYTKLVTVLFAPMWAVANGTLRDKRYTKNKFSNSSSKLTIFITSLIFETSLTR